jgi:hypothetical protein
MTGLIAGADTISNVCSLVIGCTQRSQAQLSRSHTWWKRADAPSAHDTSTHWSAFTASVTAGSSG